MATDYLKIFRETYPDRIREGLAKIISGIETELKATEDPERAFELLKSIDVMTTDFETGNFFKRYSKQTALVGVWPVNYKRAYNSFGEVISDFRRQAHLKQAEYGRASKVSSKTIYLLERKKYPRDSLREEVKLRLLGGFSISPEGKIDEILNLPLK